MEGQSFHLHIFRSNGGQYLHVGLATSVVQGNVCRQHQPGRLATSAVLGKGKEQCA